MGKRGFGGLRANYCRWELSYWEWPQQHWCVWGEQFAGISHWQTSGCCVSGGCSVAVVGGKWIPTHPEFKTRLGTAPSVAAGSSPADALSRPWQGVSLVAAVSASTPSTPQTDFTEVWTALDFTRQNGGYLLWNIIITLLKYVQLPSLPQQLWPDKNPYVSHTVAAVEFIYVSLDFNMKLLSLSYGIIVGALKPACL